MPAALCLSGGHTSGPVEVERHIIQEASCPPQPMWGKKKNQRQYMTAQWIFPGKRLWLFNSIDVSHGIASVKCSRAFSSVRSTKTEHLYLNI